jgi:hypothetical protein
MNNTRTLGIAAILIAATLVVGVTFAAATTVAQSAFAYSQKKDNGKGNGNGNTVTIEECKNKGSASGFDTALDQECENLICTHPGENATCVQEGAVTTTTAATTNPTSTPKTCVECFTKFLNSQQLELVTRGNPELFCATLPTRPPPLEKFESLLTQVADITGQPIDQAGLIQCLRDAGITFATIG